jgi:hypothetical protein
MPLSLNIPLNRTSFGNVSFGILFELFQRGEKPIILPIGPIDLATFSLTEEFGAFLKDGIESAIRVHSRKNPTLKLWHINGLLDGFSEKANSFTFHETDRLTDIEAHILSQQDKVFVSSNYTKSVFEKSGLNNVIYCPLGFDSHHFSKKDIRKPSGKVVTFGLYGKMEGRKNSLRIIRLWKELFGSNPDFRLNCLIHNSFMDKEMFKSMILNELGGDVPWNINLLPFQDTNLGFNDVLNAADIDLTGLSSCEGFNLPLFQSLCLGKHAVVLNAHAHSDFCTAENSILVEPLPEMREASDGMFFKPGGQFNQGQWHDFSDQDAKDAMLLAVKNYKENGSNSCGEKLASEFSWKKTVDILLENLD